MATIIDYCPMCEEWPRIPQDPLEVPVPKICRSCQAIYGQMFSGIIAAGKVKALSPGESAPDKEKANRSKSRPP